ncbi:MAG: hypothetical protein QOJ66_3653 [Ilumatobacteraceae bacterium]
MPPQDALGYSPPGSGERAIHLRRLTTLRAFAALLVFGNHIGSRGGRVGVGRYLFDYGYTGVSFFFVLSGFVLAWTTVAGASTIAFYVRRFARIYPSHLVMLGVALLVPVTVQPLNLRDIVLNAGLLQTWFFGRLNPYTVNGVSWSLSCEVAFYAVLPFVLVWAYRRRPATLWLFALSYWALASAVTVAAAALHRKTDAVYVFPPLRFGEFVLGVVAAICVREGYRLGQRSAATLAAVGLALMALSWNRFPAADVGGSIVFLALILLVAQRDLDRPDGLLTNRWLVYAGQVSFAFYLVHELIIINIAHTGLRGWPLDPVAFLASVGAAVALHHFVERPCEKRLRGIRLHGAVGPVAVADRPLPLDG